MKSEAQRCKQSKIKFFQATMMLLMMAMFVFASPAQANNGTQDDTFFQAKAVSEMTAAIPCCLEKKPASAKKSSIQHANLALETRFCDEEATANTAASFKKQLSNDISIADELIHNYFNKHFDAAWFTAIMMSTINNVNIDALVQSETFRLQFNQSVKLQLAETDMYTDMLVHMAYFGKMNIRAIEAADAQIDDLFRANKY